MSNFSSDYDEAVKYADTLLEASAKLLKNAVLEHDWKIGELIDHNSDSKGTPSVSGRHPH